MPAVRSARARRSLLLVVPGFTPHTRRAQRYDNLQQYDLSQPEDIFDVDFYRRNPRPFVSLAKEIWPGRVHSPTLTHSFLSLLASKGKLRRAYTQNIDGLEVLAGLPPEKVVECHGHFRTASCVDCGKGADIDRVVDVITRRGEAPACDGCGGYVKPDVVFFGEDLPGRFHRLLRPDLQAADLLIILGTSLQVAPVSRIPDMVPRACRRALLNRELVGNLDVAGGGGGGRKARRNKKRRQDVYHEGDCDDSIVTLARLLGWHDELLELNARTKVGPQSDKRKGRKING